MLLTCCQFSLTDHTTKGKCKARLKSLTICGLLFYPELKKKHTVDNCGSYMQIVCNYSVNNLFDTKVP